MLQCTDIKKQPTAQGVTEIVSDGLPKPSRVNIVTKENL